jgi:hypothetical protein
MDDFYLNMKGFDENCDNEFAGNTCGRFVLRSEETVCMTKDVNTPSVPYKVISYSYTVET